MKRLKQLLTIIAVSLATMVSVSAQTAENPYKGHLNFFIANDLGRNGYYEQRPIATLMGEMAETVGPEFIAAIGDVHHYMGVESTADPLWMTNFELIYDHPELQVPWYPVLGNHEYRGNTQAVLDYSRVSRRWQMPARYYTKTFSDKRTSLRLVFLDTTPLIQKYREDSETYPDACKQDAEAQLQWLDSVLTAAREQWIIVIGHHPIYAETPKDDSERADMQASVGKILARHKKVTMYVNGHIHNFQHIEMSISLGNSAKEDKTMTFVTNTSGSLSRKVAETTGTQFCSPLAGFSIISANSKELVLRMIDSKGEIIHEVRKTK